jgi:cell division initiation protein
MKLNPLDIRRQQFKKAFRGIDPAEVGTFLDFVAQELEDSLKSNKELQQKITEMETRLKDYVDIEKALQQTFMQVQETTGKAIENARKEAQLIIQGAELKAAQILDKSRADLTLLKEQLTILNAKKNSIVSRLRALLNSELDLIKALDIDGDFQPDKNLDHSQEIEKSKTEIDEIIKSLDEKVQ